MDHIKKTPLPDSKQTMGLFRTFFLLFIVLAMLVSTGAITTAETTVELEPLTLENMRIVAYSKSFAKRFGLPMPEPGFETTGGLEAVEFAIEKGNPWAPYYYSNYRLYINSSLPIAFPEETKNGDNYELIPKSHFFGQTQEKFMRWQVEDRRYIGELQTRYFRNALLATMDYEFRKHGASTSLWYKAFRQELFPDLDFIHINNAPNKLKNYGGKGVGIWLKKVGGTDYREKIAIEDNHFFKFKLPNNFYKKVLEFEKSAYTQNRSIDKKLRK